MAHFGCICGERLWNGLAPNDIEISVYKGETLPQEQGYIFNHYDIWKCPTCSRVYSFKNNKLDKMFMIEDVEINVFKSCLCGEQDFQHYLAYTDFEVEQHTSDFYFASDYPKPPRDLWSCNSCNRFYLEEFQYNSIQTFKEIDYYSAVMIPEEETRPRIIYLIPNGFVGKIEIYYGKDSYPLIEEQNNEYVFEIPNSGVLKIANQEPDDGWADDQYYYVDLDGNRVEELDLENNHQIFQEEDGTLKEVIIVES
ncbi:DUF6843 domain-containing protein [Paenibacillus sp. GCM10027627]|uniref:DUF6843 domain-containing protein n=1 Tax=unclassified Paenibacillus TaxID=185978 RepID=UPI00363960BC